MDELGIPSFLIPNTAIQVNPVEAYLSGLAKSSAQSMTMGLRVIARIIANRQVDDLIDIWSVPWHNLTRAHLQYIQRTLAETLAPATVNTYIYAVKGVCKECYLQEYMTHEAYMALKEVKALKKERGFAGRAITPSEFRTLLTAAEKQKSTIKAARDTALVSFLYSTGIRRSKLLDLTTDDIELIDTPQGEGYRIEVRRAKGNKSRVVFLNPTATKHLIYWLSFRGPGVLFCDTVKLPEVSSLHSQTVYDVLKSLSGKAGMDHVRPHDLRRAFVTNLLSKGTDIFLVQKLIGHSSPETTARYDRRDESELMNAAFKLTEDFSN